jgi:hypothetical protein
MSIWKLRVAVGSAVLAVCALGVVSIPPARAAFDAIMSCAQTTPCLEWDNTKSGDAVRGVSSRGNALHGQTKFNSMGKTAGKAGVFGEDLSTSGNLDAGVNGVSTNGAGVLGISTSWNAVEGLSTNSTGVYGQTSAAGGFGAAGRSTSTTHNNGGAGILADGGPANDGIHAFANGGSNGVYAFSQSGSAIVANTGPSDASPELSLQDTSSSLNDIIKAVGQPGSVLELKNNGDATFTGTVEIDNHDLHNVPFLIRGATTGVGDTVISLIDSSGGNEMRVDDAGNIVIGGLIYTNGSCGAGCLEGNKRVRTVGTYAPAEAEPTVEDNGEAKLVDGRADVPLDPRFANVIDSNAPYLVTLTPEGDCRGLFVTHRTTQGFMVRELQGGQSNVGFSYRIVAKRFGVHAPRLPMTAVRNADSSPRRSQK